jgi:predicted transcriptional regulator
MIARELMTGNVVAINSHEELITAVQLMIDHGFRHVPILEGGSLKSIITALGAINGIINNGVNALKEPVAKHGSDKFIIASPDDDAVMVIKKMLNNNVDAALILRDNDLTGIITERDVVSKMPEQLFIKYRVHEVANKSPICINEEVTLRTAMETMISHGIRHLLITEQDKLLGVISVKDILKHVIKYYKLRGQVDFNITISKLMSHNPVTIDSGASLIDAIKLMRRNNISSLPIVEMGKLMGLITERDIVKNMIK